MGFFERLQKAMGRASKQTPPSHQPVEDHWEEMATPNQEEYVRGMSLERDGMLNRSFGRSDGSLTSLARTLRNGLNISSQSLVRGRGRSESRGLPTTPVTEYEGEVVEELEDEVYQQEERASPIDLFSPLVVPTTYLPALPVPTALSDDLDEIMKLFARPATPAAERAHWSYMLPERSEGSPRPYHQQDRAGSAPTAPGMPTTPVPSAYSPAPSSVMTVPTPESVASTISMATSSELEQAYDGSMTPTPPPRVFTSFDWPVRPSQLHLQSLSPIADQSWRSDESD